MVPQYISFDGITQIFQGNQARVDGVSIGAATIDVRSSTQGSTVKLTAPGFQEADFTIDGEDGFNEVILENATTQDYYKVCNWFRSDGDSTGCIHQMREPPISFAS